MENIENYFFNKTIYNYYEDKNNKKIIFCYEKGFLIFDCDKYKIIEKNKEHEIFKFGLKFCIPYYNTKIYIIVPFLNHNNYYNTNIYFYDLISNSIIKEISVNLEIYKIWLTNKILIYSCNKQINSYWIKDVKKCKKIFQFYINDSNLIKFISLDQEKDGLVYLNSNKTTLNIFKFSQFKEEILIDNKKIIQNLKYFDVIYSKIYHNYKIVIFDGYYLYLYSKTASNFKYIGYYTLNLFSKLETIKLNFLSENFILINYNNEDYTIIDLHNKSILNNIMIIKNFNYQNFKWNLYYHKLLNPIILKIKESKVKNNEIKLNFELINIDFKSYALDYEFKNKLIIKKNNTRLEFIDDWIKI